MFTLYGEFLKTALEGVELLPKHLAAAIHRVLMILLVMQWSRKVLCHYSTLVVRSTSWNQCS